MSSARPALADARVQPGMDSAAEIMMLGLLTGDTRDDLIRTVEDVDADGELDRLLPDVDSPTMEDGERFVDEMIRDYHRLVPEKSADALRLEEALDRVRERGVAVVFGESVFDAREGAELGYQRAREMSDAIGYCYSHVQDLCRLAIGMELYLGFSGMSGDLGEEAQQVGRVICEELERVGFTPEWNGSANARIIVDGLVWEVPAVARPRDEV